MIAKLTGTISEIFSGFVIIDVHGVGYRVEGYSAVLEDQQKTVEIYVSTYVREQEIRLFGFKTREELIIFEELLGVSGVGPKAAIALVNILGLATIISAIASNQASLLRVPGVGGKTAEKIVIELKNKVDKLGFIVNASPAGEEGTPGAGEETGSALLALGFTQKEVSAVLHKLDYGKGMSQQDLIKKALNLLHNK